MEQKAREEKKRKELGLEDKPLVKKTDQGQGGAGGEQAVQEEAGTRQ